MKFPDFISIPSSGVQSDTIGHVIEELASQAINQRRKHERRWYDNNFFDDGYHFRVISRKTGRVIDTLGKMTGFVERAIPRASLQIRGVSNLLYTAEPYPVVYPQRISMSNFTDAMGNVNQQLYDQVMKQTKDVARKQGMWLSNEWEKQDLDIKIIDMMLLAAKNSISYIQVWTEDGRIKTEVYDAFDILTYGDKRNLKSTPFIIKTKSRSLEEIKNDQSYDPEMTSKLTADNKYATSEIKDAYQRARFGSRENTKEQSTIIEKETFMKEVLTKDNWKQVIKLTQDNSNVMEGKSIGDIVMRHPFSAGGVTLKDEYVDYDEYPFAYFRFEPGPLYQTPFIERFIPQNKSLDVVMTRLEKWVNSMVVGIYQKRKGENFEVSNFPGGQMVSYETTPLTQMQTSNVGGTPFQVISLLDKYIEEQGATVSSSAQIPSGVKSGNAIESLKASEYANLKIATKMLKKTIKQVAELMLERADKDILEPQEVEHMEDGEPSYFDIIGQRGMDISQKVNKRLPDGIIPISKDLKVRIEIEPGLGLTMDGKRNAMQEIINFMIQLSAQQLVPIEAIKLIVKRFLETFGYGSTQEFMEAFDEGMQNKGLDDQALQKMKIAIAETLKEVGAVGPEADNRMVDTTKIGSLEALKESGILKNLLNKNEQGGDKGPSRSISFKDLPPDGQVQLAQQAGIQLNPQQVQQQANQLAAAKAKVGTTVNNRNTTTP